MKTLAIETSCDDTSIAIVNYDGEVFSVDKILAYSQVKEHDEFGGVVPEIASRLHAEKINSVLQNIGWDLIKQVDFISVTTHPGLPGSLLVGKATANLLGEYFDKEVVEVNHIQGHIFSVFLDRKLDDIKFPMAMLTASGGHNDVYIVDQKPIDTYEHLIQSHHQLKEYNIYKIGASIDDAAGEGYDKVARMLGGPYPGGYWMDQLAASFDPNANHDFSHIDPQLGSGKLFRRVWVDKDTFDFSFSGVKSQIHNFLDKLSKRDIELTDDIKAAVAYEFQSSVIEVLNTKLLHAADIFDAKSVSICGGVSASKAWRDQLQADGAEKFGNTKEYYRPVKILYSTDNAAMIGLVGILKKLDS